MRTAMRFALLMAAAAAGHASAGGLAVEPEAVMVSKLLTTPAKLVPGGATANAQAGAAVAIGFDIALVGAPQDAARGAVYVYARNPATGSFSFVRRLVAPDGADGDNSQFGLALALQGDRLVVGAPFNANVGAAYVFTRVGNADFALEQKLVAGDAAMGDEYGTAVALDGQTVVVGARLGNFGATNGGAVYIYTKGVTFTQQQKLTSETAAGFPSQDGANFGTGLAIAGNELYAGAPFYNGGVGLMLKFTRSASVWSYSGVNRDGGAQPSMFGAPIVRTPGGAVYVGAPNRQSLVSPPTINGSVSVYDDSSGFLAFVDQIENPVLADTRFGGVIAADDGTLLVGSPLFDTPAPDQGEVVRYIVPAPGAAPVFRDRLVAPDAASSDKFGTSVAFFGGAILIGATGDDDAQSNAGAAYAYDTVVQETNLVDPAGGPNDVFGTATAIAGNVKMVGVPHGSGGFGAVEIYMRLVDAWTQGNNDIRLGGSIQQFECGFGTSVAMSDDTRIVVVGAPKYGTANTGDERGRAFVFERDGDAWIPAGVLDAGLDAEDGDHFGASVSISPDGNRIVVGAPDKGAQDAGKVYVFGRPGAAAVGGPKGAGFSMTGSRGGGIGDKFGTAVGIDDAGTVAVGAPLRNGGRGAVEVLRESGGTYVVEPLVDPGAAAGDNFGTAVALRDGELAVGIPNADRTGQPAGDNAGAAMLFDAGPTSSTPRARLVPPDARIGDKFGSSVGVSGGIAIVGSPLRDVPAAGVMRPDAGSARLLVRNGTAWSLDAEIVATDFANGDNFGAAVAIRDLTLTAGSPLNDNDVDNFADQGASYVFRIGPRVPVLFESGFE